MAYLRVVGLAAIANLACAVGVLLGASAHAQTFPDKPLRIIVPFAPGGALDLMGRQVARSMSADLGQAVIVENVPGAGGAIGIAKLKNYGADGYSMILLEPGAVITPLLDPQAPFNLRRDFEPVSIVAEAPLILGINAAVPAKTLKEFVALAKSRPGQLNFSSPGNGTAVHMTSELFKTETGVDIVHVPYKGGSSSLSDVAGGSVQMTFLAANILKPYFDDGRLRGLASSGPRRSKVLPDLPTFAEAGFPNVQVTLWTGLFVVKNTPPAILARLQQAAKAASEKAEFQSFLATQDFEALGLAGQDADRFVAKEEKKWSDVIKANKLK